MPFFLSLIIEVVVSPEYEICEIRETVRGISGIVKSGGSPKRSIHEMLLKLALPFRSLDSAVLNYRSSWGSKNGMEREIKQKLCVQNRHLTCRYWAWALASELRSIVSLEGYHQDQAEY